MENQGFNPNQPSGGMYPPGGYPPPPQGRPVILTVFGILTFVACGFAILGALANMAGITGGGSYGSQFEQPAYIHLLTILISGAKVFGVIQMFQLKRLGFFAYTGAELFSYVILLLNWDQLQFEMAMTSFRTGIDVSMVLMGTLVFSLIFSAVWIGVYASQLRHMK